MLFEVECPECGSRLATRTDIRGKIASCPSCSHKFQVPQVLPDLPRLEDEPDESPSAAPASGRRKAAQGRPKPRPQATGRSGSERGAGDRSTGGRASSGRASSGRGTNRSTSRPASRSGSGKGRDRGPQRRRGAPSRRREEDFYDEDDLLEDIEDFDDEEDEFDDLVLSPRQRKAAGSKGAWPIVKVGTLIVAIAGCVFGAGLLFGMLSMAAMNIGHISVRTSVPDPEDVRDMSPEERFEAFREMSRRRADAMRSAATMRDTSVTMMKVSQVTLMIAAFGLLIGCVLWVPASTQNGARGLAIAVLVVSIVNLILRVFFKLIPVFKDGDRDWRFYDYMPIGMSGGRIMDGSYKAFAMFVDMMIPIELLLGSLFLMAIAKTRKTGSGDLCRTAMYLSGGFGIGMLVFYIFMFFAPGVSHESMIYISWVFFYILTGAWIAALILYVRALFKTRSAV